MAPTLNSADAGKVRLGGMAPTLNSADAGKVRLGGMAPTLNSADAGKVRLGGMAPTLNSADAGKVRLGGMAPTLNSADAGKVRLGGMAPTLNSADAGKVRLGGMAPTLNSADAGKVRLGGMAPTLPPATLNSGYHYRTTCNAIAGKTNRGPSTRFVVCLSTNQDVIACPASLSAQQRSAAIGQNAPRHVPPVCPDCTAASTCRPFRRWLFARPCISLLRACHHSLGVRVLSVPADRVLRHLGWQ